MRHREDPWTDMWLPNKYIKQASFPRAHETKLSTIVRPKLAANVKSPQDPNTSSAMQANCGINVNAPQNQNPLRARGGMSGNPFTRIHFDKRTKPQFCWPPPLNPQVHRKASIHRPPAPPTRKTLARKVAAAAEAKKRGTRSSKSSSNEGESGSSKEKGIFGIFDVLANFVPWPAVPSSSSSGSSFDSNGPTRHGSFSTAPGAYPSSFVLPPSSTPDLSSDDSDDLPSSSVPSSPSSVATTLSDLMIESLVLDTTASLLEASAENENEIADYHAEEMFDFQKALNEQREQMDRASKWAASEEFKEQQRRQSEESRRFHESPEHVKEAAATAARRKRDAELSAFEAHRMAEFAEVDGRRKLKKARTLNRVELEEQEPMGAVEGSVSRNMKEMKRRRDAQRRRNAARHQEEARKAETDKAEAQSKPKGEEAAAQRGRARQQAEEARARKAEEARQRRAEADAARQRAQQEEQKRAQDAEARRVAEEEEADRWARGDDLKSYIKHLRRDIAGMRAGKRLPETLAGGYRLLERPRLFGGQPLPKTPRTGEKNTGYQRFNSTYPRPRHQPFTTLQPSLKPTRSRQRLFFESDDFMVCADTKPTVVQEDPLQVRFAEYERRWATLSNPSPSIDLTLTFGNIPWPLLKTPTSVEEITLAAVSAFLFHAQRPDRNPSADKSRRTRLKEELLRWHPDKFEHRVLRHVVSTDRETVLAGADAIIKVLNDLRSAK